MAAIATACACGGGETDDRGPGFDAGTPGGPGGGGSGDGGGGSDGNVAELRVRYPTTQTQSPITADIAEVLNAIADNATTARRERMFAKVGSTSSNSELALSCFASSTPSDVKLDGRTELQDVIAFYRAASFSGPTPCTALWCSGATTPFNRQSFATADNALATAPLEGTTSGLSQEDTAIAPAIALVEFGTFDSESIAASTDLTRFVDFYTNMAALTDAIIDRGTVPVLLTIPPKAMSHTTYRNVPTMNALIRLLAQSRAVPLVDYYRTVVGLTGYGLEADGLNPRAEPTTGAVVAGCDFTPAGLLGGANQRNLAQLMALDRVRRVLAGGDAPDSAMGTVSGDGSADAPYVVDGLPFVDSVAEADTSTSVYSLRLEAEQYLRVVVVDPSDGGDVSFVVREGNTERARGVSIGQAQLDAGDYTLTVSGRAFAVALLTLDADDPTLR